MSNFPRGTLVTVVMTRNDVFHWQRSCGFMAKVLHTPSGPGDCFILDIFEEGLSLNLNGNSSEFVGMYTEPEERDL